MYTTRVMTLFALSIFAQGVLANTIWLKDRQGNVCYNSVSNNPDHIIGYGGVDRSSSAFTMTIDNPPTGTVTPAGDCQNIPKNLNANPAKPAGDPIVFNGTLTRQLRQVHMWKPGTDGRLECLAQGQNLSGVTGSVTTGTGTNQYSIGFGFAFTDGCNFATQQIITANGLPTFTRTVFISQRQGNAFPRVYEGNYQIFNVEAVPEPSSMLLLLAGAFGLGVLALSRRKAGKRRQ